MKTFENMLSPKAFMHYNGKFWHFRNIMWGLLQFELKHRMICERCPLVWFIVWIWVIEGLKLIYSTNAKLCFRKLYCASKHLKGQFGPLVSDRKCMWRFFSFVPPPFPWSVGNLFASLTCDIGIGSRLFPWDRWWCNRNWISRWATKLTKSELTLETSSASLHHSIEDAFLRRDGETFLNFYWFVVLAQFCNIFG